MSKNKCRGCVRVGGKQETKKKPRGDFLPIRMKRCHCCIRNPNVRQKKDTFINGDRVGDYFMSKSHLIHQIAKRRGMGAVNDDGRWTSVNDRIMEHNTKPSYTKRERKYLKKKGSK